MAENYWAAYVQWLMDRSDAPNATAFAKLVYPDAANGGMGAQPKIRGWLNGERPPREIAVIADFARRLDRNPLEAFVAAGALRLKEALRSLDNDSMEMLAEIGATEPQERRAPSRRRTHAAPRTTKG